MKYMVFDLTNAKTFTFDSMTELLDQFKCVTEARVNHCIESGDCWKGLTFDIVDEDSGDFFEAHPEAKDYVSDEEKFDFEGVLNAK